MRSDRLGETLLPKRLALPVFASDALSSVAYAPDEILLTLGLARRRLRAHPLLADRPRASSSSCSSSSRRYRQNVHAYPSGGGDYEVATRQPRAAGRAHRRQRPARRLRAHRGGVDLVRRRRTPRPPSASCAGNEVVVAVAHRGLLTAMNLRGVRESGTAFAVPTYLFMVGDHRDGAVRASTASVTGDAAAGRERAAARCSPSPATRRSPGWPRPSCCCGPSRPAARR